MYSELFEGIGYDTDSKDENDNYEKLLEEKIENAKRELYSQQMMAFGGWDNSVLNIRELRGQIEAYEDALNEYRRIKAKEGK